MNPFFALAQFLVAPLFVLTAFFGFGATTSLSTLTNIASSTGGNAIACTMEAKECPDGSWVGRHGPHCDFDACPSATTTSEATSTPAPHPTPAPQHDGVRIYKMSPTSGPVGTEVTITGFGFTSDNTIHFGGGAIQHVVAHGGPAIMCMRGATDCVPGVHQSLTFTVPSSVGPVCPPGTMCPMYRQAITNGTYAVYVENANGSSAPLMFTVSAPHQEASSKHVQMPGTVSLSIGERALAEVATDTLATLTLNGTTAQGSSYTADVSVLPGAPSEACSQPGAVCFGPMIRTFSFTQGQPQTVLGVEITLVSADAGSATFSLKSVQ